jgi:hypothetical protein
VTDQLSGNLREEKARGYLSQERAFIPLNPTQSTPKDQAISKREADLLSFLDSPPPKEEVICKHNN